MAFEHATTSSPRCRLAGTARQPSFTVEPLLPAQRSPCFSTSWCVCIYVCVHACSHPTALHSNGCRTGRVCSTLVDRGLALLCVALHDIGCVLLQPSGVLPALGEEHGELLYPRTRSTAHGVQLPCTLMGSPPPHEIQSVLAQVTETPLCCLPVLGKPACLYRLAPRRRGTMRRQYLTAPRPWC